MQGRDTRYCFGFLATPFSGFVILQVDKINRSVAARMAGAFTQWRQLDEKRQALIRQQLQGIVDEKDISENLYEVASKSL